MGSAMSISERTHSPQDLPFPHVNGPDYVHERLWMVIVVGAASAIHFFTLRITFCQKSNNVGSYLFSCQRLRTRRSTSKTFY